MKYYTEIIEVFFKLFVIFLVIGIVFINFEKQFNTDNIETVYLECTDKHTKTIFLENIFLNQHYITVHIGNDDYDLLVTPSEYDEFDVSNSILCEVESNSKTNEITNVSLADATSINPTKNTTNQEKGINKFIEDFINKCKAIFSE